MNKLPVMVWQDAGVGIIELARPEKLNALSRECLEAILEAVAGFESDGITRAILISAQGSTFCSGADLAEVGASDDVATDLGHRVLNALEDSPIPVIAAVQGLCLAGGLELMLACDVVIAGVGARIGDQHARYGLIPGWGGSQRLPRLIGLRRALDFLFSASWVDADTALQWGLVTRVVPDEQLQDEAMAYCYTLAKRNPEGIALMKRLARQGVDMTLQQGLDVEKREIPAFLGSDNVREGLKAFVARREPDFK